MSDRLVPSKDGAVIVFLEKSDLLLGVVVGSKGSSYRLLGQDQRERLLPQKRVLAQCGSVPPGSPRELILERLTALQSHIIAAAAEIDLPTLWEALEGAEDTLEPAALAAQWYGRNATDEQAVAMTWAVLQESIRFKLKGLEIKIQPREVVEQKLAQREQAERRERQLRETVAWIRGGAKPEEASDLTVQLKEVALFGAAAPRFGEIRDTLHKLGPAGHEAVTAFESLVAVGVWSKDENLEILREGVPLEPEPEVLRAAGEASRRIWDRTSRSDWTDRDTFSIDPPSTRDVDDALTCWIEGDRLRVAVHITDVTEFVDLDKELDLDARMRGLSIYLPAKVIPMLPPAISEGAASLIPGDVRPAMSLIFEARPDGTMQDARFERTIVRVTRKLSYAEVDRALPEDPLLKRLLEFCVASRQRRVDAGAVLLPLPEVALQLNENKQVEVRLEPDTESHQMVAELMICFNSNVARWCAERGSPALFRGQPEPRRRLLGAKAGLLECLLQRRGMLRSVTDLKPTRHGGLGLDFYTMTTSPLRRYLDLCMEWQLRSLILGQPPTLDAKRLEEILPYLSLAHRRAQRIERGTERFWMYRWLADRADKLVQALWLEPMAGKDRAALLPFLSEVEVDLRGHNAPGKGSLVDLEVVHVAPREAELKLAFRGVAKRLEPISEPLASMIPTSIGKPS